MVRKYFKYQGKTNAEAAKNKAKSNDKNKFRDKVPKILKGGEKGGKGKKKVIKISKKIIKFRNGQKPSQRKRSITPVSGLNHAGVNFQMLLLKKLI